jgi:hypothetical protein
MFYSFLKANKYCIKAKSIKVLFRSKNNFSYSKNFDFLIIKNLPIVKLEDMHVIPNDHPNAKHLFDKLDETPNSWFAVMRREPLSMLLDEFGVSYELCFEIIPKLSLSIDLNSWELDDIRNLNKLFSKMATSSFPKISRISLMFLSVKSWDKLPLLNLKIIPKSKIEKIEINTQELSSWNKESVIPLKCQLKSFKGHIQKQLGKDFKLIYVPVPIDWLGGGSIKIWLS